MAAVPLVVPAPLFAALPLVAQAPLVDLDLEREAPLLFQDLVSTPLLVQDLERQAPPFLQEQSYLFVFVLYFIRLLVFSFLPG